ncbi:hypothetical protein TRVA0_014S00914 [Trichomonascus vanleenenianus]|uniref:uncharacterized protein n=1 Tax=Trichomonascus vanleenenianus TaxID=2268995 RepID=UPI003EC967A1
MFIVSSSSPGYCDPLSSAKYPENSSPKYPESRSASMSSSSGDESLGTVTAGDGDTSPFPPHQIPELAVAMSQVYSEAGNNDDSLLIENALRTMLDNQCAIYNPEIDPTLRIVSICTSSETAYKYVIPQLLHLYNHLYHQKHEVQAQITHVVPPHKTVTMLQDFESSSNGSSNARRRSVVETQRYHAARPRQQPDDDNGGEDYFSLRRSSLESLPPFFSVVPKSPYVVHKPSSHHNQLNSGNRLYTANNVLSYQRQLLSPSYPDESERYYTSELYEFSPSSCSPPLSPSSAYANSSRRSSTSAPTTVEGEEEVELHEPQTEKRASIAEHYSSNIYNSFALVSPHGHGIPSVPPGSAHYALAIHPIPTHVLPPFETVVRTRFTELMKGGMMLVCYPSSMRLYDEHVLPCLDRSLHQLIALNMISTQACEQVSMPPSPDLVPSYADQRTYLQSLQGAEVLYASEVTDFRIYDWGYRWLNEEVEWIRSALCKAGASSAQLLVKLVEGMTTNENWSSTGVCDVSVFVVKKV